MRILLVSAFIVAAVSSVHAQVLSDFGDFGSDTYFSGSWSDGSSGPAATFVQGAGFYTVQGVTNEAFGVASHYFLTADDSAYQPIDFGLNRSVSLTAMLLPANSATSLLVTLWDTDGHTAAATFDLTRFSSASYSTVAASLNTSTSFNWNSIGAFDISGTMTSSAVPLAITFDGMAAVPEPATYAAVLGSLVLGVVGYRRFRKR